MTQRNVTLAVAAAGLFLAVLSTTVVSIALPTIGPDLSADPSGLEWMVDAYVLVYASLLIPGGVIADRYGRKGIFLIGALFGIGALSAGLAGTLDFLLAARIVQGLGPALLFGLGLAGLLGFARWERNRSEPLVDVALFLRTGFTVATVAAAVVFFAFVGAIVYFSTYFQQVQGATAVGAGVDISAIGVAYALTATLSGRLVGRIGERVPLVVGLLVSGVAMLGLLRLAPDTAMSAIWWNFAVLGAGIGLCGTPMTTIAMSAVDTHRAGMASAVVNSARQVGQVFGVAVLGAVVDAGLPDGQHPAHLDADGRLSFVVGLHRAVLLSGCALLGKALLAAVLLRHSRGSRS